MPKVLSVVRKTDKLAPTLLKISLVVFGVCSVLLVAYVLWYVYYGFSSESEDSNSDDSDDSEDTVSDSDELQQSDKERPNHELKKSKLSHRMVCKFPSSEQTRSTSDLVTFARLNLLDHSVLTEDTREVRFDAEQSTSVDIKRSGVRADVVALCCRPITDSCGMWAPKRGEVYRIFIDLSLQVTRNQTLTFVLHGGERRNITFPANEGPNLSERSDATLVRIEEKFVVRISDDSSAKKQTPLIVLESSTISGSPMLFNKQRFVRILEGEVSVRTTGELQSLNDFRE